MSSVALSNFNQPAVRAGRQFLDGRPQRGASSRRSGSGKSESVRTDGPEGNAVISVSKPYICPETAPPAICTGLLKPPDDANFAAECVAAATLLD
jgi:hypothetical protein